MIGLALVNSQGRRESDFDFVIVTPLHWNNKLSLPDLNESTHLLKCENKWGMSSHFLALTIWFVETS